MPSFHKEGYRIIVFTFLIVLTGILFSERYIESLWFQKGIQSFLLLFLIIVLQFFRNPKRVTIINDRQIIAPVDGKVVVIEEVEEPEYFKGKRLQVSIFMSPINVHVTRYALNGIVKYSKYHPGKYLVAWHPKSSTENERHSVVYRKDGKEILVKQIAGALAKRICNYVKPGQSVHQTDEMGFIKFGSRVDLLLPLDAKIHCKIGDRPQGGVTVIATW